MKKGDTLFNEQFIILHDPFDNSEILIRKNKITCVLQLSAESEHTTLYLEGDDEAIEVQESVDEIIELL